MLKILAERKKSQVDPMIYGQFIEHFHRQIYGGVYDPESPFADEDGLRTDVLEAMRKIQVPILRWPGGCFVSAYHWKDGVGKDRRPMFDKAWRVEEPNDFGTDEYVKLCRKIGCEPYICTNAGTGTAEEMSDWVEYCNLKQEGFYSRWREENGYEEPHAVKYWSIGNENYGSWEMGAKDSIEWGKLVRESAKMMKRADPTIELSAAALTDMDWNMELLKACGERLSWISIHGYWDFHNGKNELADYENCLIYTEDLEKPVRQVKGLMTALGHDHIRIAYDEWNLRAWYHPNVMDFARAADPGEYLYPRNDNDINRQYTMADAVFTGCFLNMCIRNSDVVGMANFSPVVNTRGMICTGKEGIVLRPTYHVFDLYVSHMGKQLVDFWETEEEDCFEILDAKGEKQKIHTLDAVAAANEDTSQISIAVTNKHPEETRVFRLDAGEKYSDFCYKIYTVNGPDKNSYNDWDRQEVGITESQWEKMDHGKAEILLQAHSVNVIVVSSLPDCHF